MDKITKSVTEAFFENYSINNVHNLLLSIFGDGKLATPIIGFYLLTFYLHFRILIDANEDLLQRIISIFVDLLLDKEGSISENETYLIQYVGLQFIFKLLAKKYVANLFLIRIVLMFQGMSSNFSFLLHLNRTLVNYEYKILWRGTLYVLSISQQDTSNVISWDSVLKFARSTSFEDYKSVELSRQFKLSSTKCYNLGMGDAIFAAYNKEHKLWKAKYHKETKDNPPLVFEYTKELFMSFLLMTLPEKLFEENSKIIKAISMFDNFKDCSEMIYGGLVKYFHPKLKLTGKYKKFTHNAFYVDEVNAKKSKKSKITKDTSISDEREEREFGYTFHRFIYFSGRFDLASNNQEITLDLPGRMVLTPRIGKQPHVHYVQQIKEGTNSNNEQLLPSKQDFLTGYPIESLSRHPHPNATGIYSKSRLTVTPATVGASSSFSKSALSLGMPSLAKQFDISAAMTPTQQPQSNSTRLPFGEQRKLADNITYVFENPASRPIRQSLIEFSKGNSQIINQLPNISSKEADNVIDSQDGDDPMNSLSGDAMDHFNDNVIDDASNDRNISNDNEIALLNAIDNVQAQETEDNAIEKEIDEQAALNNASENESIKDLFVNDPEIFDADLVFRMVLLELFPNPLQMPFLDKLLAQDITEQDLRETSRDDLVIFLKENCDCKPITAKGNATILKKKYF